MTTSFGSRFALDQIEANLKSVEYLSASMGNGQLCIKSLDGNIMCKAADVRHGRLKIFLGAAPGVGKSYEMLKAHNPDARTASMS